MGIENKPFLSKREFLKLAGVVAVTGGAIFTGEKKYKAPAPENTKIIPPTPTPTEVATSTPTPTEVATSTPTPTPTPSFVYTSETLREIVTPEEASFLVENKIGKGDPSKPQVLVTYDDGNDDEEVKSVIDTYDSFGLKTTFFFRGDSLFKCQKSINLAIEKGHEIACHGYYHNTPLTELPLAEVEKQLERFVNEFDQIAPGYRVKYWRAPYGAQNKRILEKAADFGMQHVLWNVESGGTQPETFDILFKLFDLNARYYKSPNGLIVLSHAHRYYDITLAEKIVSEFLERGLTPVTVSEGVDPESKFNPQPSSTQ